MIIWVSESFTIFINISCSSSWDHFWVFLRLGFIWKADRICMTKEMLFLSWIPICDLVKWLDNVTMFIFKIISSPKFNFGLWRHTNRELDRNGTIFKHLSETLFMSKNQAGLPLNIFELNVFFSSYPNVGWFYSKRTASAPHTVLHSLQN